VELSFKKTKLIVAFDRAAERNKFVELTRDLSTPLKKKTMVLGLSLQDMLDEEAPHLAATNGVPYLTYKCVEHLRKNLSTEGLFRISAAGSELEALKSEFKRVKLGEQGDIDLSKYSVHAVSNMLKTFFRTQPQPIMTFALYDKLVLIGELKDLAQKSRDLKLALNSLPVANRQVLHYVFKLLQQVARDSATNQMTSSNLAICLAPSLSWPQGEQSIEITLSVHKLVSAVMTMIDQVDVVF
jgi:hypothetical protein